MASFSLAVLAAILLIPTLGASPSPSQKGFFSINCGGEAYIDPRTKIIWQEDPFNKYGYEIGGVGKVNSSLTNVTNGTKSLRYFRNDSQRKRKFCYQFQVSIGNTYLLRVSFLYGNYDGQNKPPRFVLLLNLDVWKNVTTFASTIAIVHELIFNNIDNELNICLAPHLNSTDTPFISTLEIRPLNSTMYINSSSTEDPSNTALSNGYGLMLWQRIDYGATTENEIRYPDDPYDRIWEANTTGPIANISSRDVSLDYENDQSQPPAEVMATAITSRDAKGNLSFMYEGYGGTGGFRIEMHFEEVDEKAISAQSPRNFGVAFQNSGLVFRINGFVEPISIPKSVVIDMQLQFADPNVQLTLSPTSSSSAAAPSPARGPLLNAIELFHWTPQPLFSTATGTPQDDVNAIKEIQTYFKLLQYGQGDPCLPKVYEWIWITCTTDTPPRIKEINLESFNLSGDIPSSINNLQKLQKIDFSNNKLSGQIPNVNNLTDLEYLDFHNNNLIGELPASLVFLPKLAKLDVSYNNLCGILPSFQISLNFTYNNNPRLCDAYDSITCDCSSSVPSNFSIAAKRKNTTRKYVVSICLLGALYMVVSTLTFLFIYKTRRYNKRKYEKSTSFELIAKKGGVDLKDISFISKMFTYKEISDATLNFTTILGEGGFGKVYYGILPTGEAIAVKTLVDASKQGLKVFFNEVAILSTVRHKNVVTLIGYCVENTYMLIYEYIAKGNLQDLIYGDLESADKPLPWTIRLHIALDASQGLDYLHTGCDSTIIHRDVKSNNILLSETMQAKVADFGLSRLKEGDNNTSHVSTINVVGTVGYLDPAYNATNQLTDKSDVYSFGIVLFELICGRAPIDMFNTPPHIVEWASQSIKQGKIEEIVDPMLANGYKMESMCRVVDVALQCVESDRTKRPKMSKVFQLLQSALEIEMDPNYSEDFSSSSSHHIRDV